MAQDLDQDSSRRDQEHVDGFVDCVARLLAKRWLRDQRRQPNKPSQGRTDVSEEDIV